MKMYRLRHVLLLCLLALSASLAPQAHAEDYPTRPVKIISDSAPGSAIDVTLRLVADRLGHIWGQQVLPVNQPGAGGTISARVAAEAAPDGYTLYMPALSVFLPAPGKAANTAFELPRDFSPIGFPDRAADVHCGNAFARRRDAPGIDCARKATIRRDLLCGHRDRTAHAFDR
jgi:hypothetical protein